MSDPTMLAQFISIFKYIKDENSSSINDEENSISQHFNLRQNYPNPFNPGTTISYEIQENSPVRLEIFDISGKQVDVLENSNKTPGRYQVYWNAAGHHSGIYYYKISARNFTAQKKCLLIK
ncbi:MAG: T9SS type A sorting domain-containing protein [Candidatus Marinimicrobia bacterium]|nr:T9SS type A sorting domain-containing protein [Candidatus Neomarinimicrobiota bacterium]